MLKLEHIRKEFGDIVPIKDINLEIPEGKIVTLIGPSGTGKSTLLRMINGLETPTSGKIFYNDIEITSPATDISKVRQTIGMIFQQFNLFNHLSVVNNIVIPQMDIKKTSRKDATDKAMNLLGTVGLERTANKMPSQLSGGQKQRVAIARALAMDSEVLLFDEPTSALDPKMVGEMELLIKSLRNDSRTIIIVTHDMSLAEHISDIVVFLSDGGVKEMGSPEQIFHHPVEDATREFIESDSVLELVFDAANFEMERLQTAINMYCEKQKFSYHFYNNMMSIAEELVYQELCLSDNSRSIEYIASYDRNTSQVHYRIKYSGKQSNPFETDSLSMKIVKSQVTNVVYRAENDTSMTNSLNFDAKVE